MSVIMMAEDGVEECMLVVVRMRREIVPAIPKRSRRVTESPFQRVLRKKRGDFP
jgi:hypothetical protein